MRKIIDENGNLVMMTDNGLSFKQYNIKGMMIPVVCNHCGGVYDLTAVKVNHRYADCSQFTTPCCGYAHADDRGYKSFPDFERIK